jgi:hypothetical protein
LRAPNGQIIEWYASLHGAMEYNRGRGHSFYEKWRDRNRALLSDEEKG